MTKLIGSTTHGLLKAGAVLGCWLLAAAMGHAQLVGINTATPQYTLDIQGSGFFHQLRLADAGTGVDVRMNAYNAVIGGGIETIYPSVGTSSPHPFVIVTNNRPRLIVNAGGLVGIGQPNPTAPLSFANVEALRKIVLFQTQDNDHQYYGFGVAGGTLRYQTEGEHGWYRASSSTASQLLMRLSNTGVLHTAGPLVVGNITASPAGHSLSVSGSSLLLGNVTMGNSASVAIDFSVGGTLSMGYQQVSQTYLVNGEQVSYVSLSCPAGTQIIAGGGGHRDANSAAADIQVSYSGPDLGNPTTAWRLGVYNRSTASRTIRIFCICGRIQ